MSGLVWFEAFFVNRSHTINFKSPLKNFFFVFNNFVTTGPVCERHDSGWYPRSRHRCNHLLTCGDSVLVVAVVRVIVQVMPHGHEESWQALAAAQLGGEDYVGDAVRDVFACWLRRGDGPQQMPVTKTP